MWPARDHASGGTLTDEFTTMNLTLEQIVAMAPDAAAAAAGKSLRTAKHWPELGRSVHALWGKCQGSAVYQVKVDLVDFAFNCTCPSRKLPCKHVLGLLILAVHSPDLVSLNEGPAWVDEWLQKRRARKEKAGAPQEGQAHAPAEEKARERRALQRSRKVQDGLQRLDLWLNDLVRNGIASALSQPSSFWEEQGRRLVDAQAPGLAGRVSRLASLPGSSPDWAERLLGELGRIKLLLYAYGRLDEIEPALASDIRQMIGWNVPQDELERDGERVGDCWIVAGQWVDDLERLVTRRSWVVGRRTRRVGLILHFSAAGQPFAESIVAGTEQEGTITFYPGASGQRAKFVSRQGTPSPLDDRLPGHETIEGFLQEVADSLARQPWLTSFGAVLRDVNIVRSRDAWWVSDRHANSLPLSGKAHWKGMAVSGGHPLDLAAEWDGLSLRLLGGLVAGRYWSF
jgi:SWIM zinc finger